MRSSRTPQAALAPVGAALQKAGALRMNWTDAQLVHEAVVINHKQVAVKTREEYARCLEHFSAYLGAVHGATFYTASQRQVLLYLAHLETPGMLTPNGVAPCKWCSEHGEANGKGLAPSTRKKHLCAIGFLYHHFHYEEDLPDHDPSAHVTAPRCPITEGYTPSEQEVARLLQAKGTPKARLLAYWLYFAPGRRATFADVRWRELDLDAGTWWFVGKKEKADKLALHPTLVRELRRHREAQLREAQRNPRIANALADPDTAYVLLTRNGKKTADSTILRALKWHAIRAGVGVIKARSRWDSPGGETSLLTPHSLRRAWATHALAQGVALEVIQEVLGHADISTTRRHYARNKSGRACEALRTMPIPKT